MKKPDPWVVTMRGRCRLPGVSGASGAPNSRKKRSTDAPPCSSKLSDRFVCTPITAGFTASTISAKPAGPELPRPTSKSDGHSEAVRSDVGQSCGARRTAEAPAAAANATMQTRTAARSEGARDFTSVRLSLFCMYPRCSASFALVGDLRRTRPKKPPRFARYCRTMHCMCLGILAFRSTQTHRAGSRPCRYRRPEIHANWAALCQESHRLRPGGALARRSLEHGELPFGPRLVQAQNI